MSATLATQIASWLSYLFAIGCTLYLLRRRFAAIFKCVALFLGGVLLLTGVDESIGRAMGNSPRHKEVIVVKHETSRYAIVIAPGFLGTGPGLLLAFGPLAAEATLIALDADPGAKYDDNRMADKLEAALVALEEGRQEPLQIYALAESQGGFTVARWLAKYKNRHLNHLTLNAAPASLDDVKRPDWVIKALGKRKGGPILSRAIRLFYTKVAWKAVPPMPGYEDGTAQAIRDAATQRLTAPLLFGQLEAMATFDMPDLEGRVTRATYLSAPGEEDALVKTQRAFAGWQAALKLRVMRYQEASWAANDHCVVEKYGEYVRLIQQRFWPTP